MKNGNALVARIANRIVQTKKNVLDRRKVDTMQRSKQVTTEGPRVKVQIQKRLRSAETIINLGQDSDGGTFTVVQLVQIALQVHEREEIECKS